MFNIFKKKKEEVVTKQIEVVRLSREQYIALEKSVSFLGVTEKTTATETAYQMGVQNVLKKLRDGFTMS